MSIRARRCSRVGPSLLRITARPDRCQPYAVEFFPAHRLRCRHAPFPGCPGWSAGAQLRRSMDRRAADSQCVRRESWRTDGDLDERSVHIQSASCRQLARHGAHFHPNLRGAARRDRHSLSRDLPGPRESASVHPGYGRRLRPNAPGTVRPNGAPWCGRSHRRAIPEGARPSALKSTMRHADRGEQQSPRYSGQLSSRSTGSPNRDASATTSGSRSASRKPSVISVFAPAVTVVSKATRSIWTGGSSQLGMVLRM